MTLPSPLRPLLLATAVVGAWVLFMHQAVPGFGAALEGLPLQLRTRSTYQDRTTPVVWIPLERDSNDRPASRHALAIAISQAAAQGASATILALPLSTADDNKDLARVRTLLEAPADASMHARLQNWETELDQDAELERAIKAAGNVILYADANHAPLERFAAVARGVGLEPALAPDADGVIRRDRLYSRSTNNTLTPSLTFAAWLASHGESDLHGALSDHAINLAASQLHIYGDGEWLPQVGLPATEVRGTPHRTLSELGTSQTALIAGRVLVIGEGPSNLKLTQGPRLSLGETISQRIASLESADYLQRSTGGWLITLAAALGLIAWVGLVAPKRTRYAQYRWALLWMVGLTLIEILALITAHVWVPLMTVCFSVPLAVLSLGLLRRRPAKATVYEDYEPLSLTGPRAGAYARRTSHDKTQPVEPDAVKHTKAPSLSDISKALNARLAEPTKEEVTDLLLGKRQRPAPPTLGRYQLEREVGRGAMGTVYLGRDPRLNRVVAIKAIPLAEEYDERDLGEARARFFREAEMAGRLRHPAIVTVYDAGEDAGIAWIAMEYLQGTMLNQHAMPDTLLEAHTALEVVARVADALDYAHANDVIHRDIKPANIVIDPASRSVKLMDFGIARNTNTSNTRSGIVLGTPSFMSPEQLDGGVITGRSDLFSLGVTLYQLLAGQLPFRADSMTGLMNSIVNNPHPPLRTIRPDLPSSIGDIIDRALQKAPEARYQHASEMAAALRAAALELAS
jgi:hypothetical protein